VFNPLLAALPRVVHVPHDAPNGETIRKLVELAYAESRHLRTGGETALSRLSELLFIEVVRHQLSALPSETAGWLAGLRDEHVGRALGKLHGAPTHPWTLEELAREVGMSRSMLAERFVRFVGVPAMQYLAQWRMQLAAAHLATSSAGLSEIAELVGYGSEAALSRAFKRWVGVAPAEYRRSKRTDARGAG
jgi:AraC-like DNA-binding protein